MKITKWIFAVEPYLTLLFCYLKYQEIKGPIRLGCISLGYCHTKPQHNADVMIQITYSPGVTIKAVTGFSDVFVLTTEGYHQNTRDQKL